MCKQILFSLLPLLTIIGGCKPTEKATGQQPILMVETAVAQQENLLFERSFTGPLQSQTKAVIQPRVNGFLLTKNYGDGMPVKRGELLFTIDSRELMSSQLSTEAELESARAQLLEARNNYERAKPLAKIEAISQSQLDSYAAQYAAAKAQVSSLEQSLKSAKLQVGYTRIYSPIDGIAAASSSNPGDYVGPATKFDVLTTISRSDTMTFEIDLPMREYLELKGVDRQSFENSDFVKSVKMQLQDGRHYPYSGSYDYTIKSINPSEGSIAIVVKFANPDYWLKDGEYARVTVEMGTPQRVVTIPAVAISQNQGAEFVWVVKADSTLEYRAVKMSRVVGDTAIIESGLKAEERVLTTGLQKVKSSQKITY